MKKVVFNFKTEQDYVDFVEDMKEENNMYNCFILDETDDTITFNLEDSEIVRAKIDGDLVNNEEVD